MSERFAEAAALIAAIEGDVARLAEILDGMLPGELLEFAHQLSALREDVLDARMLKLSEQAEHRLTGEQTP